MIPNRKTSVCCRSTSYDVNSQEWRSNEARDMFVLLLAEYENSKRMRFSQRYKELERIICMFTSEPVLEKLKWLSTDEEEEEDESAANTVQSDSVSDRDVAANDQEDCNNADDEATSPTIGIDFGLIISKMKMLSKLAPLTTTIKPTASSSSLSSSSAVSSPSSCSYTPFSPYSDTSDSSGICFSASSSFSIPTPSTTTTAAMSSKHLTITTNLNNNINNYSAPTTPLYSSDTAQGLGLPHCVSLPLFNRYQTETNESNQYFSSLSSSSFSSTSSFEKDTTTTTNNNNNTTTSLHRSCSNNSPTETDSFNFFQFKERTTSPSSSSTSVYTPTNQRQNEFDKRIIKKDQVPAFDIPTLRCTSISKNDKIDPDLIVPSLYTIPNPRNSCSSQKSSTSRLRFSSSSPNINRFFGLNGDQPRDCHSLSGSRGFFTKIRHVVNSKDFKPKQSIDDTGSIVSDSSDESSCIDNFDIQKSHSLLLKMKQDYDELPNWNVVSRYVKMKKMLKSVKFDLD